MISGGSPVARRVRMVLLLIGAVALPSAGVGAEPGVSPGWGVEQLMRQLAQIKAARAAFVERKHLAILKAPLESSGTLIYIAPDRLEKHTAAPRPERLVLEREELVIENPELNRRHTLALRDHPLVRAYVESIRSTLAGDLQTLTLYYRVALAGSEHRWRLTLKPSERAMQEVVTEIRIDGERAWISVIEIVETGGDRSVMSITRDGA